MKVRFSTIDLVGPAQICWAFYMEGRVEIAAKVLKDEKSDRLYISLPTAYRKGTNVPVVKYETYSNWQAVRRDIIRAYLDFAR